MATTKTTTKKTVTKKAKAPKVDAAISLDAIIYNQKGVKAGTIALPEKVFGLKWNGDLVHQVVVSMMANKRAGTAHTKDRSEVSGGGIKPWKQKGTGQARHGSSRSPIWRHGGITFGPRSDKDYSQKINKKMRVKALYTILSQKFADNKILFIDTLTLSEIKTKDAHTLLTGLTKIAGFEKLGNRKPTTALIALPERNEILEKSFANLPGVTVTTASELNAKSAMDFNHIVMINPEATMPALESKMK